MMEGEEDDLKVNNSGTETEAMKTSPPSKLLDPSAPEFFPSSLPAGTLRPGTASSSSFTPSRPEDKSSSLIFGGGGHFLSKYNKAHTDKTAKRTPGAKRTAEASSESKGIPPDRVHVQLNQQLVACKNTEQILRVLDENFDNFNAVNLITALHRLASIVPASRRVNIRKDARFKRLISRLSALLRSSVSKDLTPQDLSNSAWALTKLGLLNMALFGLLSEHIRQTISQFEPVNLSMTLWAFARSGFLDEPLFRAAAREVREQLSIFEPQQLANTTWAMAKSGLVDEELFSQVAKLSLETIDQFQPMNFSMLLYSFAVAKIHHAELFTQVAKRCTAKILTLSRNANQVPHIVSNLVYAFSEAGIIDEAAFKSLAQVSIDFLHEFRAQQIACLATAYAKAKVRDEQLFQAFSTATVARLSEFRYQDVEELREAFEALGFEATEILRAVDAAERKDHPNAKFTYITYFLVVLLLAFVVESWRQSR